MFESFMAAPAHFTIEFGGFLVCAGGALLVLSRPSLVPGLASNRVAAAAGFAALAVAQALHGASFFEADGIEELVALRTLGFVLLFFGVSGGLRAAPAAAFSIREPLLFAPAGASFLLSLAALVGSLKGGSKALRRLAVAGLLLAASEVLTAAAPNVDLDTGVVDRYAYIAHGLKLLGFMGLGVWLYSGVRSSIRARFVASFAALLVAVTLVIATALTGVISNNVVATQLERIEEEAQSLASNIERTDPAQLRNEVEQIAQVSSYQEAMAAGENMDRAAEVLRSSDALTLDANNVDVIAFLDPKGDVLGFAGRGPYVEAKGEVSPTRLGHLERLEILGSRVIKDVVNGFGSAESLVAIGGNSAAILSAVEAPHPAGGGRMAGIVAMARFVDALTVQQISDRFTRASLVINDEIVASGLAGNFTAEELLADDVEAQTRVGEIVAEELTLNNRSFFNAYAPLTDAQEHVVGILVLSSSSELAAPTREGVTRTLFLVAIGVGAIALILAWLSGRRITRPIQHLTATARAVREGNLEASATVSGEDEVGQLGETFNEMTQSLRRMTGDLREAAAQEHSLRARIETIIQSMAEGLVAVDADRKVLAFNREAERLTGIKASRAVGKPVERVLDVRDAQGDTASLPVFALAEGSVDGVFIAHRAGGLTPVAVTGAVLRDERDEAVGAVAVLRDMTREREIERMKSEFLSNISHELRTPLTPIKGYAEILGRKNVPPEKADQFIKGILDSTDRLQRIVELLVDFAAMEAGRLEPRSTPVDLGAVVEGVAKEWGPRATRHHIVTEVKSRLPKVAGDERLLRRSLEEILDNAVKFSPQGGTIRLEARSTSSADGPAGRRGVEVTVSDEGIGISPEDIHKIFSDFHQLDGSETRTYGGLGLGLTFVQRIIQAHSGSVRVESEPEHGTRLTITIPAFRQSPVGRRR